MKNLTRKLLGGGGLLSALALAGPANATTYTVPANTNDWSYSLSAAQSSASAGTLVSVSIALTEDLSLVGTVRNKSSSPGTISFVEYANLGLSVGSQALTTSFSPVSGSFSLASHESQSFSSAYTFSQTFTLTGTDMAPFEGEGTVPILAQTLTTQTTTSPGSILLDMDSISGATVEITYNYAPIPEPSVCALMVAGAGALALRRRSSR